MAPRFEIVISAENVPYMAWQALVFRHSCVTKLGLEPIVMVHGDEERLIAPFEQLVADGGRVQRARNYRLFRGFEYPPRNSPASLWHVETEADYVVLCDPDLVIVGRWDLGAYALAERAVSFDSVSYLVVGEDNGADLAQACRAHGVTLDGLRDPRLRGGIPHIVPAGIRRELARTWLECLDSFFPEHAAQAGPEVPFPWLSLASMWGIAMAARCLGCEPVLTRFCETNHRGDRGWPDRAHPDAALIHYCYGDARFDKRRVRGIEDWEALAPALAAAGTVHCEVASAIAAAGAHHGRI